MKEHIKIFTGTSILVNRLAFLLDEEGIASLIKNPHNSSLLAGFGTTRDTIELYIFNSDKEIAEPIIEDFKKEIL